MSQLSTPGRTCRLANGGHRRHDRRRESGRRDLTEAAALWRLLASSAPYLHRTASGVPCDTRRSAPFSSHAPFSVPFASLHLAEKPVAASNRLCPKHRPCFSTLALQDAIKNPAINSTSRRQPQSAMEVVQRLLEALQNPDGRSKDVVRNAQMFSLIPRDEQLELLVTLGVDQLRSYLNTIAAHSDVGGWTNVGVTLATLNTIRVAFVTAIMALLCRRDSSEKAREFMNDPVIRVEGVIPDSAAATFFHAYGGPENEPAALAVVLESCGWIGWEPLSECLRKWWDRGSGAAAVSVVDAFARHDCLTVPVRKRLLDDGSMAARFSLATAIVVRISKLGLATKSSSYIRGRLIDKSLTAAPVGQQIQSILLDGSNRYKQTRIIMDILDLAFAVDDLRLAAFALRFAAYCVEDCPIWVFRSFALRVFSAGPAHASVAVSIDESAIITAEFILVRRSRRRTTVVEKVIHDAFVRHQEAWVETFVRRWVEVLDASASVRPSNSPIQPFFEPACVDKLIMMLLPRNLTDPDTLRSRAKLIIGLLRHKQVPSPRGLQLAASELAKAGLSEELNELEQSMRAARVPLQGMPHIHLARQLLDAGKPEEALVAVTRGKELICKAAKRREAAQVESTSEPPGPASVISTSISFDDWRFLHETMILAQLDTGRFGRAFMSAKVIAENERESFTPEFRKKLSRRKSTVVDWLKFLVRSEMGQTITASTLLDVMLQSQTSYEEQKQILAEVPGMKLDQNCYLSLMKLAVAEKGPKAGWKLLKFMDTDEVRPDNRHLNLLWKIYVETRNLSGIAMVEASFIRRNIEPDVATVTTRMVALASKGYWEEAESVFKKYCSPPQSRNQEAPIAEKGKVEPDAVLFDEIIRCAADQGDAGLAHHWYLIMRKYVPRTYSTHSNRIVSLVRDHRMGPPDSRNVELAMRTLNLLEEPVASMGPRVTVVGLARSDMEQVRPYLHLMRAHARLAHPDRVVEVFRRCVGRPEFNGGDVGAGLFGAAPASSASATVAVPPIVHEVFMDALWQAGDGKSAVAHLHLLLQPEAANGRLAQAGGKREMASVVKIGVAALVPFFKNAQSDVEEDNYFQAAATLLEVPNQSDSSTIGPLLPESVHSAIISGRLLREAKVSASNWWERCTSSWHVCFSAKSTVDILKSCGRLPVLSKPGDEALRWFELLTAANADLRKDTIVWTALLQALACQPGEHQLLSYLDAMRKCGATPNAVTYLVAMNHCATIGDSANLKELVEAMETEGFALSERHWTILMSTASRGQQYDAVDALWRKALEAWRSNHLPANGHAFRRIWPVPEAATSVYIDSLGFRGDLDALNRFWAWLTAEAASLDPIATAPTAATWSLAGASATANGAAPTPGQPATITSTLAVAENHCNSYLEALLRLRRADDAVGFALNLGRKHPWQRVVPTPKTFRTVVSGLWACGEAAKAQAFSVEFRKLWPRQWHYVMQDAAMRERLRALL